MLKDFRYAIRDLSKHAGFSTVAVITLALGIGANTAIFSVINSVLFQPLPYPQSDQLVVIWGNFLNLNIERLPAKAAEYTDYTAQTESFEAVAAFTNEHFDLLGGERPERVSAARVTPNFFSTLRIQPAEGRGFSTDESQAGRNNVAILSHRFWQQRFGGDPRIINQTVRLDDGNYTIVGVMPAGFAFPIASSERPPDIFVPLTYTSDQVTQRRGPYYLTVLGRLNSGTTLEGARGQMSALAQRLQLEQRGYRGPNGEDGGWRITVVPLRDEIVGDSRRALLVLFGAVSLVLIIACANVANLLMLRAARRQKEMAIRSALGATRWKIIRQLFIESLLLTVLGTSLGIVLARWGVEGLVALSSGNLPRTNEISINARVLLFTSGTTILTTLILGLAPALKSSKLDLYTTLKGVGKLSAWDKNNWSNFLVVAEVALSLLLLIAAGLLGNSLLRLQRVNPGASIDHLLSAEINLSPARYREPAQASSFYSELVTRVESLPGVQTVSFGTLQPLEGAVRNDPFVIEGRPLNPADLTSASWQLVGANYFRTLGIPLSKGRDLNERDLLTGAPGVAVINEKMASRYWPNEDPLGRRITLGLPRPENPWITIVGISKNLPHRLDSPPQPDWYVSRTQGLQLNRHLLVRTEGDVAGLANAIRNEVQAVDPAQPVTSFESIKDVVSQTIAPRRVNTLVLTIFAAFALGLAALGIYSVISYSVALRTQEIGIRMALGAQRINVLQLILKRGMMPALAGTAIGLLGAFALTRLMTSLLFEISPTDPLTYFLVALFSISVALVACYFPARRATRVDPLVALRYE